MYSVQCTLLLYCNYIYTIMILFPQIVSSANCPDYTQHLAAYMDLVRKTFPELSVGVLIDTMKINEWYNNPTLAGQNSLKNVYTFKPRLVIGQYGIIYIY